MGLLLITLCVWIGLAAVKGEVFNFSEGQECTPVNGFSRICKKLGDCPKALADLDLEIIADQCNPGDGTVVCCETQIPVIKDKSKEMCKKYSEFSKTCNTVETTTNRTAAKPREFPHMALVGCGEKNSIDWVCSGSLISERFVLGVGHCKCSYRTMPKWVRLGDYNIASTKDEEASSAKPVDFEIIHRTPHPNYKNDKFNHDIALYKLNADVQFNEYIIPICLERERQFPTANVLNSGWCVSDYTGSRRKDTLQKANQLISSNKNCDESYRQLSNGKLESGIEDESMLCAQDSINWPQNCRGDFGAPLQYQLSDPKCMYSLVGVTFFGSCRGNLPAVYYRVSNYVDWIEKIVWP